MMAFFSCSIYFGVSSCTTLFIGSSIKGDPFSLNHCLVLPKQIQSDTLIASPTQLLNQRLNILCGKPFGYRLITEKQHDLPENSRFIPGKLEPDLLISDSHHRTPHMLCFCSFSYAFRMTVRSVSSSERMNRFSLRRTCFIVCRSRIRS